MTYFSIFTDLKNVVVLLYYYQAEIEKVRDNINTILAKIPPALKILKDIGDKDYYVLQKEYQKYANTDLDSVRMTELERMLEDVNDLEHNLYV